MADESTTTPATEDTTQTQPADGSGGGGEPRTFTQEQVDKMIQARIARVKSTPPDDYEELKAKAARLDELEEAQKSDLQRAQDATAKAKAKADDWKAKYEALQQEQARTAQVTEMAAKYKVDLGALARMTGDVEDNAKYLAQLEEAKPKYGAVHDGGELGAPSQPLEERLAKAKTDQERVLIRAQWKAEHRTN